MFLTIINTKLEHLIPEQIIHEGQLWAEPLWEEEGGLSIDIDQRLMAGNFYINVIAVFLNKKGDGIAYWMVQEGEGKQPFFKTHQEVTAAIQTGKLRLI